MDIPGFDAQAFVAATLAEDVGAGDVTSRATLPHGTRLAARLVAREPLALAGAPLAAMFFRALDPDAAITAHVADGDRLAPGDAILRVEGDARAMLTAERSALNTLCHLSGIATLTAAHVAAIAGTGATLLDTRKTVPGLRLLAKYAVRMGGGANHRLRLDDGVLIKDNHVAAAGDVAEAVRRAKAANTGLPIQVEVDTLDQIEPALAAGADRLLLDNMPPPVLREAVALVAARVPTEASGGINLQTIRAVAETGVTYISTSRITQSAPAVDIGMDFGR